ncbi:MAG: hypothetical protein K0S80_1619, partial [Neobacillus sp.]|nr:hypothetical protein [Neobacillus sp.]
MKTFSLNEVDLAMMQTPLTMTQMIERAEKYFPK